MLPHRLLVSNPLLVQGSWFRVRGSRRRVRCPMSDVAKGEERVPSEAGDIWLALAGVPPRQQPLQVPSDIGGSGGAPRRATARSSPPARGKVDRGGRRNPRLGRIGFDRETHTLNRTGSLRRTTVR